MSDTAELCPFCGKNVTVRNIGGQIYVEHPETGCVLDRLFEYLAKWNIRPYEDALKANHIADDRKMVELQAEIAALRADLGNARDERNMLPGYHTLEVMHRMECAAVKELQSENERLKKIIEHDGGEGSLSQHCACVNKLEAENERMRNALMEYASETSWNTYSMEYADWWTGTTNGYDIAREALKGGDK